MSKLEIGMYVRTEYGIRKITNIGKDKGYKPRVKVIALDEYIRTDCKFDYIFYTDEKVIKDIKKASFDIIDLIKPKDIILGRDGKLYQCWKIYKGYVFTYSKNKYGNTITLVDYQIDRVLTKEQFESMSYRIGDEK